MNARWTTSVVIGVAVWLVSASGQAPSPRLPYRAGELLVEFRRDTPPARLTALMATQSARRIRRFEAVGIERIQLRSGQSVADALAQFAAHPDVASVQPNYERGVIGTAPPNDPFWLDDTLWGLRKIQADTAWTDYTTGDDTVVIANVDTGVNYAHPDLAANMWRNPGEVPGNLVDDDGNGYVDDVYGIDTANNDGDPMDDHGHGTHTAGTTAASGNNGVGVVGVSWRSKILACKFMTSAGSGYDSDAIECFNYVVALRARGVNVRVTNNSWGSPRTGAIPNSMRNAINAMGNAGIVSVFAAGNSGVDNDTTPHDPASIPVASIISVASSNGNDQRSGFSNYGVVSTDLAAPGEGIASTRGDGYAGASGTSMAAPHVAGAAALLASAVPSLSMSAIKSALLTSVDQSPTLTGLVVSGGRLNVWRALMAAGANARPTISITNPSDGASLPAPTAAVFSASASDPDGTIASVEFFVNGTSIGTDTTIPYSVPWNGSPAGTHTLRAKATDNLGATREATVTVSAFVPPVGGATATFLGTDTSTQGNWIGAYGSEGQIVSGDVSTLPGYANVILGGATHIWAASPADVRALQRDSGASRVAGTRYGSTFSIDVNISDGQPHEVSLYLLDWDQAGRTQRVDVIDATSSVVLATRTVNSFGGGQYLVWRVGGHVRLQVTSLAGPNAVVSGVFFGHPTPVGATPAASATFLGTDAVTQGNWMGSYGTEGYGLAGDTSSLPGYATVTVGGASHVWASNTAEVRALQRAASAGRVAATWYGSTFSIDLNLTDGQPHQVALYLLDWDVTGRSERIDVLDADSSAVLSSQTTNAFNGGRYLVWTLSGHVRLQVTSLAGPNAVVAALFFGLDSTPGQAPTSATFVGTDATTQGNWAGTYGSQGYAIAGDASSLPSYATAAFGGAGYVWSSSTADVRALQRATAAGRVAGTWYGGTFSIDLNLTDGQSHQVALYLLDWDTNNRQERIDVIDAASSAVLDSRTISAFNGGRYLVWTLSGHVRLQMTSLAGFNAVVGGLFFGSGNGPAQTASASTTAIFSSVDRSSEAGRSGTRPDWLRGK